MIETGELCPKIAKCVIFTTNCKHFTQYLPLNLLKFEKVKDANNFMEFCSENLSSAYSHEYSIEFKFKIVLQPFQNVQFYQQLSSVYLFKYENEI